jgi:hypothetical protein
MSDNTILDTGFECLQEKLGLVGAERFISLVIAEPSDYTKWRENLFKDMTLNELCEKVMQYQRETNGGVSE